MTKALSTLAILSALIASPAFAQDTGVQEPTHHVRTHERGAYHRFRGAYNESNAPIYAAPGAFDRRTPTASASVEGTRHGWVARFLAQSLRQLKLAEAGPDGGFRDNPGSRRPGRLLIQDQHNFTRHSRR